MSVLKRQCFRKDGEFWKCSLGDCHTKLNPGNCVSFYNHVFENHSEVFFSLGDIIFLETENQTILVKVKRWFEKAKKEIPEQVNSHLKFFANQIDHQQKRRKIHYAQTEEARTPKKSETSCSPSCSSSSSSSSSSFSSFSSPSPYQKPIKEMSIKEIKEALSSLSIDPEMYGFSEREDLIDLLIQARYTPSPSPSPSFVSSGGSEVGFFSFFKVHLYFSNIII